MSGGNWGEAGAADLWGTSISSAYQTVSGARSVHSSHPSDESNGAGHSGIGAAAPGAGSKQQTKLGTEPAPSKTEIRSFLERIVRSDIHLVAIIPDGSTTGEWFGDDVEAAVSWAAEQNKAGRGLYWTVNKVRRGVSKKCSREDIVAVRFICGDLDLYKDGTSRDEVLSRLRGLTCSPSFVIDSGNGLQPFWSIDEIVGSFAAGDFDYATEVGRNVAAHLNGDAVQNVDRVLRLPGTVNYPNLKKRERGLVPVMACVAEGNRGATYSLKGLAESFPALENRLAKGFAKVGGSNGETAKVEFLTADDLSLDPMSPLRSVIEQPAGLDRSVDVLRCAGDMKREGYSKQQVLGVLMNPLNAVSAHVLEQADPRRAALKAIEKAFGDKPIIRARPGALHEIATEAEAALIDAKAYLFVRGESIVRPIIENMPAAKSRFTKVARLSVVKADTLRDHLSKAANWVRYDLKQKKEVPTDPPKDVAATILSRDGDWRFPRLAGIITTPTLRPDGTILSEVGYDQKTQLLLLDPPVLPPIAEGPTRADAEVALRLIDSLLQGFPFIDDESRSVALSMLITPIVRGAMPVAPMHVATAPVAGSGKSYLVDLAQALLNGERAPVMAAGKTEEETEKRLGAMLFSGQPIISIDNLNGELRGDQLCQIIERPVVAIRVLGLSKMVKIESRTTIFATGNNIKMVEDMTRRAVLCSLDPELERPELRQFPSDPLEMILADRGAYVAAVLTIVRAYVAAGCPSELPPLASFEGWSKFVRSPLVWLGCADPVATMEVARADDPVRQTLEALLSAWHEAFGTDGLTVGELKQSLVADPSEHAELSRVVSEIALVRGSIDSRVLGKFLSKVEKRIASDLKLVSVEDKHAKQKRWSVQRVELVSAGEPRLDPSDLAQRIAELLS